MDNFAKDICGRLPLAEAVLQLFHFVMQPDFLDEIFQRHRGRCYEKVIRFPVMVQLMADALLQHEGSGHRSFQQAQEDGDLTASERAAYGKLNRLPLSLSQGLFVEATGRLQEVFPAASQPLPASLQDFEVTALDGKKIKHLAKRLKVLRKVKGQVLGGKLVVALSLRTNLAVAVAADADGLTGDQDLVPEVLRQVGEPGERPRLWVADRLFCDLTQPPLFTERGDHFVIRYCRKVSFQQDQSKAVEHGQTADGVPYYQEWGWLGKEKDPRRCYVRRLTLQRPDGEAIIVITDLLDSASYPATDLLTLYLMRWGIERLFQNVTEVFHLQNLIGSTPQATVFQAVFCFLLYNMIQVIRGYVAVAQQQEAETISIENLFYDVTRQLISWHELLPVSATVALLSAKLTAVQLRERLTELLRDQWKSRWRKSPKRKYKPPAHDKEYLKGGYTSVYRLLHTDQALDPDNL